MNLEMESLELLNIASQKMALVPNGLEAQAKIYRAMEEINKVIKQNQADLDRKKWLEEHQFECPYCGTRYKTKEIAEKHKEEVDEFRKREHARLQDKVSPLPKLKTLPIIDHGSPNTSKLVTNGK